MFHVVLLNNLQYGGNIPGIPVAFEDLQRSSQQAERVAKRYPNPFISDI
jgi:hypothetical protein